ncbi:beta-ketoacyl synthase N-terminal-like domain-containing protein [Streptosporangium sp. NPDC000396]|uniref:beta-ketoacyl synthase N-terminal-like domain-containing protein n=1 Tax=Streptosporangium sp. NPDC000396 TaxID=3366185 RepID=UPI003681D25E
MPTLIAGSAVRTCLGGGAETFAALLRGECGAGPLRHGEPDKLNVFAGYHIGADDPNRPFRAGRLLAECLGEAVRQAGLDTGRQRVTALVGTGLRELSAVEDWALTGSSFPLRRLHFADVVREALPGVTDVITISNACSAGGHVLALAQDLVELGEADAVVVGATDTMTQSMLAMIGRVAPARTARVRPFDRDRDGVLLGEGAAALVVVAGSWPGRALARLAGTGLSCDARHETAPDVEGICRSMRDAFDRSGRDPSAVDLVVAHGTGTDLNDPAECEALREVVVGAGGAPLVTAVKGSVGHTSGSASLVNVDVALRCLAGGVVPPVAGQRDVLDEGAGLRFVLGEPVRLRPELVQVNAFGFGGVNAVTLLEAA